jgi:hypothetical protein
VFDKEFSQYPSATTNQAALSDLTTRLRKRAQSPKSSTDSLFVLEAGVMPPYKIKRFVLGLSTIFQNIKNPQLRRSMEQIGMQALLTFAPEFGLIALGGGIAGAVSGSDDEFDGPPKYFSEAVDRSFGFEVRFPSMTYPPADTHVKLGLTAPGKSELQFPLPVVSPLQEMFATELKNREGSDMFAKALTIGAEYAAVLVPAVIAYRQASQKGNVFQKIAILAGYFIAKKAIDSANNPDLRAWNTLPQLIAADLVNAAPGVYDAKVTFENHFGSEQKSLGQITIGSPNSLLIREHIGEVPILNHQDDEAAKSNRIH